MDQWGKRKIFGTRYDSQQKAIAVMKMERAKYIDKVADSFTIPYDKKVLAAPLKRVSDLALKEAVRMNGGKMPVATNKRWRSVSESNEKEDQKRNEALN